MATIQFDLPVLNPFNHGPLSIGHYTVPVSLELTAGENSFTSAPIEIGNFFHYKVFAHLSIPYSYDPATQYITIPGPDDFSNKQIAIHTSLNGHPDIFSHYILNSSAAPSAPSNVWNDYTDNTPIVTQVIQTAIRQTIHTLVEQLLEAGIQGVIQTGRAPVVTPDNYQDFKAMFKPEKADVTEPSLDDIIEVQSTVGSTYGGTITWAIDYAFANVIGSTYDPRPNGYNSWIQLWCITCNNEYYPTSCTSLDYSNGVPPFDCNITDFVGGHVIPGTTAEKPVVGSTVYIYPICKRHNGKDAIYMSIRSYQVGVVLNNYFQ
ncbi:MAG: hypothetical protein V4538_10250 [Bacteroidota bacterium]